MTHSPEDSVPLRRLGIDRLVRKVAGKELPDDNSLDKHLIDLLDDTERTIPHITFEQNAIGEAGLIDFQVGGPKITYDPAATFSTGHPDPESFRTAALLHEVMHAVCDLEYEKPPATARDLYGRNFHIPTALGADYDRIGTALRSQMDIADANFAKAAIKLEADRSKIISANMRQYILQRFGYGKAMPDVHYDSVLFELLIYMTLQKAGETPTFAFLRSLSAEARERRLEKRGKPIAAAG